jgi:2-hydroxy-3-keto-5-methylthiopentenyl-1-phosphate phosphatase
MPSVILVFDFDRSLVPTDTDESVAHALNRDKAYEEECAKWIDEIKAGRGDKADWIPVIDAIFGPFTPEELREAARSMPLDEAMTTFLREIVLLRDGRPKLISNGRCQLDAIDFFIVSGANDACIEGVLEGQLGSEHAEILLRRRDTIHSSRCHVVDRDEMMEKEPGVRRRSRMEAYERNGHQCERCNLEGYSMMCKGRIVEDLRRKYAYRCADPTVVFVGDGLNDHCVMAQMRARDVFFVRQGHSLHRRVLSQVDGAPAHRHEFSSVYDRTKLGVCTVVPWADYNALVAGLRFLIYHGSTANDTPAAAAVRGEDGLEDLPDNVRTDARLCRRLIAARRVLQAPLMLFGEDPVSFRGITITHRMPDTVRYTMKKNDAVIGPVVKRRLTDLTVAVETQPVNQLVPTMATAASAATPGDLDVAGTERAAQADARERQQFWLPALTSAAQAALLPSSLGAFGLAHSRSAHEEGSVLWDALHWNDLPWLHGEIFFHRLLHLVYGSEEDDEPRLGLLQSIGKGDGCRWCNLAQGARKTVANLAHCTACSYDHTGYRAVTAARWDFYRFEKAESMSSTLKSHIVPSTAVLYAEYKLVIKDIYGDVASLREVPPSLRARVVNLVHAALLNCVWGNCVDLCLHQSVDVSTLGHASNRSDDAAEENFNEAYAQLKAKPGLVADGTYSMAKRLTDILLAPADSVDDDEPTADSNGRHITRVLDLVLDNAGVEVSADLVLATIVAGLAHAARVVRGEIAAAAGNDANDAPHVVVCLHCKAIPFYVSDVVPHDVGLALHALTTSGNTTAAQFAAECVRLFDVGSLALRPSIIMSSARELRDHGVEYFERFFEYVIVDTEDGMQTAVAPKTRMVLCKGDLNFRRAIGDRHWNAADAADFTEAVSSYWPTMCPTAQPLSAAADAPISLAVLRTCKCEIVAGVPHAEVARLDALHNAQRPMSDHPIKVMGDANADVRKWVKDSWRVNGTHAVALIHPQ